MTKFVIAAGITLTLAIVTGFGSDIVMSAEAPQWVGMLFDTFSYLCYLALVGVTLAGLWQSRHSILEWLRRLSNNTPQSPIEQPEEAKPIQAAMDNLTTLLAQLQPSVEEADSRLMDARVWTETLVNQILAVIEKVEDMERQASHLSLALDAINSGNRAKVAYCAGKVSDATIKKLLLSPYIRRENFKTEAVILISNEIGALEEWGQGYERFITALFSQVIQARNRALALEQGQRMLEASHPILLIEQSLGKAQEALQLRTRPGLRYIARQSLPTLSTHLLDR